MSNRILPALWCALVLVICACSREQSDWQKTRESNSTDAYEQFLKNHPTGEFSAQAKERLKSLTEERDWRQARDADTAEAYESFLKQHPEGKNSEEARVRIENFTLAQSPNGPGSNGPGSNGPGSAGPGPAGQGAAGKSPSTGGTAVPPAGPPAAGAGPAAAQKPAPPAPPAGKPQRALNTGNYGVQLGAFTAGKAAAKRRWAHLRKEYPKLLSRLSSKVVARKSASGTLYRLEAMGVTEIRARNICKSLKAASQPCVVIRPARAKRGAV